jgi:ribose transport system ATP-binding protein
MTVLENMRVGRFSGSLMGLVNWRKERAKIRQLLDMMGLDVEPDALASRLPQAERALVGFAAAVQTLPESGGILILDEPTACLPPSGANQLFSAIRSLTARGSAVVFVSHRIDEVFAISDRISVLREGRLIGTYRTAETSQAEIVGLMLGRELSQMYPERIGIPTDSVLTANNIRGRIVDGVDLTLRRGEILGVTGLVGMGQDELPYLIYGALPTRSGTVVVEGSVIQKNNPRQSRATGVTLLPADRASSSGVLSATVGENLTLPILNRFFKTGFLRHKQEARASNSLLTRYAVRSSGPDSRLGALSGGNQQKVLLAKWLQSNPKVILLHEPTQGVDIGSRSQIFRIVESAAATGAAVLIASSEYEDLAHLCDRVIVLSRGRIVAEIISENLSEHAIISACLLAA